MLRSHVERLSGGRWAFSGGTDLVLVNGWIPEQGEPVIDCPPPSQGRSARARPRAAPSRSPTSSSESSATEDASYGVGDIIDHADDPGDSDAKKVMIGALGGIAAALGKRGLGI